MLSATYSHPISNAQGNKIQLPEMFVAHLLEQWQEHHQQITNSSISCDV